MRTILLLILFSSVLDVYPQHWEPLNTGIGLFGPKKIFTDSTFSAIYVTGNFQLVDGLPFKRIAKWDGFQWDSLGPGLSDPGRDIISYSSSLYVCGTFNVLSSNIRDIAVWNGGNWDSINVQPNLTPPALLSTMAVINGELYVGGQFDSIGGIAAISIAKWDGNSWSSLNFPDFYPSQTNYSAISTICWFNGKLYVGGRFWSDPVDTVGHILSYNGNYWEVVGGGIMGNVAGVTSLEVYNNELYVAGIFTKADGNYGNNIQRWNGNVWSDVANGTNGQIFDLEIYNNELYAGGAFVTAGNIPADKISKFDGSKWCSLGSSIDNTVLSIAAYDSTIFIGGGFVTIDSDTMNYIAKWNGGNFVDSCSMINNINEISEININIYPSPTSGGITIPIIDESKVLLSVFNILGEVVYENQVLGAKELNLDASRFSSGVYYLILRYKDKILKGRFIKE